MDENITLMETRTISSIDGVETFQLTFPIWKDAKQYGLVYYDEHTIYGISENWATPTEYTVPTTLSVSELAVNIIETCTFDLETLKELAKSNAYQIACIMNSAGHFGGKKETTPESEEEESEFSSFEWVMWTFIKKWVLKGISDFWHDTNDVDMWGENFPNAPWMKRFHVSGQTIVFGKPWTTLGGDSSSTDVQINGAMGRGGLQMGSNSSPSGIKTGWLFVRDCDIYARNMSNWIHHDVNLLCEG